MHDRPTIPANRYQRLLWLGAGALAALIAAQAWLGASSEALADERGGGMVSTVGPLTVMTAEGTNEDLLLVLDSRAEMLFVYRTEQRTGVQLAQRLAVPEVFGEARARSQAQQRP